jgi:hypothetical protein
MTSANRPTETFREVFSDLFGQNLGAGNRPWTVARFADEVGVAERTVAYWKSGKEVNGGEVEDVLPDDARYQAICSLGFKLFPVETEEQFEALKRLNVARRISGLNEQQLSRTNFLHDWLHSGHKYSFAKAVRKARTLEVSGNVIRLLGRDWTYFRYDDVRVTVDTAPYEMPELFRSRREEIVNILESNSKYFNGPHTRLIDCSEEIGDRTTERHALNMTIGPLDWEEFAVVRHQTDELLSQSDSDEAARDRLLEYVPVVRICEGHSPAGARTPCILDTATTIVTSDGWLAFGIRTRNVQHFVGGATSAVAENIQQKLDRSISQEANDLLPSPFRAALRGIAEELSSELLLNFRQGESTLLCTGVSFDLVGLHPDALFLALIRESREQVELMSPAKDLENKIFWVRLDGDDDAIFDVLSAYKWTGAGFASLVRALEVLTGHQRLRGHADRLDAAARLRRENQAHPLPFDQP